MVNTSPVYARIDTDLKESAEGILHQLGITPSSAIQMLYSQIVLTKGFPLNLHLSYEKPEDVSAMTREDLDIALIKGFESAKNSSYTAEDVDKVLKDEFNI